MGFGAAKFELPAQPRVRLPGSFLATDAYMRFLQATHPDLHLDLQGPLPSYMAPLCFYEPLKNGWIRSCLRFLARYGSRLGAPQTLFLGSPFEPYEQTAGLHQSPRSCLAYAQQRLRQRSCGLVVVTNVCAESSHLPQWERAGFKVLPSFPDMVLNLPGTSFADFLKAKKSKVRNSILRNMRKFDDAGLRIRSISGAELKKHAHHFQRAYHHMFARAQVKWLRHTASYFECLEQLGDHLFVEGAFDAKGRLVGFVMAFDDGDRLHGGRIGVIPTQHKKNSIYFRLIYALLERGYQAQKKQVVLEPTSYAFKGTLGANARPMVNLVAGTTPFWRVVMFLGLKFGKMSLRHLESPSWLKRNI
ncbi:MAG: hypothetical protein CMH56_02505 [Myxococcales bacterium]|nr:hypothetical protein [Myxococcales bacterium]|tara:strand:+ start:4568 stop:5647 length:1080 start_codon:yes stop_codon:yes gene_type:complete